MLILVNMLNNYYISCKYIHFCNFLNYNNIFKKNVLKAENKIECIVEKI